MFEIECKITTRNKYPQSPLVRILQGGSSHKWGCIGIMLKLTTMCDYVCYIIHCSLFCPGNPFGLHRSVETTMPHVSSMQVGMQPHFHCPCG